MEKNYLKMADRERGRFRSFLLASLKNYLADQWHRAQAQKRGGEKSRFQLDFERAETHYQEPAQETTPETLFEQQWAATVLGEVLDQLRDEAARKGSAERFDHLQGFLTGDSTGTPHKQVAQELGISEEAVRVSIHRMRRRFGKLLRDQIALTVAEPEQVDNEIRYLFTALAR
jgi:RNA polymerase sigma-70 factor (ECF subfamily)